MDLSFTPAGFVVGFIIGLTGVGGGSLMTPILVLMFSISPAIAVGTDLLYAAVTKCGGIFVHNKNKTIHWRIVGLLAAGSIPSSLVMITVLAQLKAADFNYDHIVTTSLGIALILTSLVLLFKNRLLEFSRKEQFDAVRKLHTRLQAPMTVICGILIGLLVTLSSVGAGALGAAILFFLYPRMSAVSIIGTDLAHAVPLTAIAGIGHYQLGGVDFNLLFSLLLGSLPGIYLGSHVGLWLPEKIIRPILASMLFLIGLRFAF